MTNEEGKKALTERCAVICDNLEYAYISALIYRLDKNGAIKVNAELYDKCGHSITETPLKSVMMKEQAGEKL